MFFFFQAEDGIRDRSPSRGLGDVYKRQPGTRARRWPSTARSATGWGCRCSSVRRQVRAAAEQREHQRAAAAVLPQGHQPACTRRRPPGRRGRRAQRSAPPDPRLGHPRRASATTGRRRRCRAPARRHRRAGRRPGPGHPVAGPRRSRATRQTAAGRCPTGRGRRHPDSLPACRLTSRSSRRMPAGERGIPFPTPLPGRGAWRGWQDDRVADLRRHSPEPTPGPPEIRMVPGMAQEMLRDLAPILAEEGIDVDNIDVPDLETLQRAMNHAVERRNMELFSPVGPTRDIASATLRLVVEAVLAGDTVLAGTLLDQVQPESPDNTVATVASCIGIALGLLDDWMSGQDTTAPAGLAQDTSLPTGHFNGERAAIDILVLARKGRAFRSLDKLLVRQGGHQVLPGSALALAAATRAWAQLTDTPPAELIPTRIR